ncbi:hypothetical protein BACCIP111899_03038 [Bacillus rhizoplanae]|uniref:Uncharacterized protein n=1 Tax=Bacillus rhizoplanae TaxID=2880966 RepID=A0ABM8YDE1_9BACI|nr:hypothetical protein BACCIP111899_03038 [Bacillus rhizoplanae]
MLCTFLYKITKKEKGLIYEEAGTSLLICYGYILYELDL